MIPENFKVTVKHEGDTMTKVARGFLEIAQNILKDGREVMPMVMIDFPGNERAIFGIATETKQQQREALHQLSFLAGALDANYAIHVTDAYVKKEPKEDWDKTYKDGDLAKDPESAESLIVVAFGPKEKSMMISQVHRRDSAGNLVFEEPWEMVSGDDGMELGFNIFPKWWDLPAIPEKVKKLVREAYDSYREKNGGAA